MRKQGLKFLILPISIGVHTKICEGSGTVCVCCPTIPASPANTARNALIDQSRQAGVEYKWKTQIFNTQKHTRIG